MKKKKVSDIDIFTGMFSVLFIAVEVLLKVAFK